MQGPQLHYRDHGKEKSLGTTLSLEYQIFIGMILCSTSLEVSFLTVASVLQPLNTFCR